MIHIFACCDLCGKREPMEARTVKAALAEAQERWMSTLIEFTQDKPPVQQIYCETCSERLGLLVACHGEAHDNPYIDHCLVCAPRWGLVPANPLPVITMTDITRVSKILRDNHNEPHR